MITAAGTGKERSEYGLSL